MNKLIVILAIVFLIIAGGLYLKNSSKSTETQPQQSSTVSSKAQEKNPKFDKLFKPYTESNLNESVKAGKTLIFFAADWCPTCKAAEKDIERNVDKLPDDLEILKANYDTERALKKKYGVTIQHTFVQIDQNGEEITKWVGGGVATILDNME